MDETLSASCRLGFLGKAVACLLPSSCPGAGLRTGFHTDWNDFVQVNTLVEMIREVASGPGNVDALRRASSVLYVVTKVRGYKTVVKFFPHEVVDLELCLSILKSQDTSDHEVCPVDLVVTLLVFQGNQRGHARNCPGKHALTEKVSSQTWETRYVLLLWLSILVIVPFDLSTIDSMLSSGQAPTQVTTSL